MPTIEFHSEERQVFSLLYQAFLVSKRVPKTLQEIDTAISTLHKLKTIGVDLNGQMQLTPDGGSVDLTNDQFTYLESSIAPPHMEWTHQGLEVYATIRVKLEHVKARHHTDA